MSATGIIDHVVRPHVAMTEDKYLHQPTSTTESFLPTNMPGGVARVVNNILALFEARTMAEHCRPMPMMSRDVVWDAPPFLLSRKGSVRVSSYFFKAFAQQCFVPSHVEVRRVGLDCSLLEVSGTLEVFPRRTIFIPASLLLPIMVPIRATLQIGVNGPLETGEVELVVAKWHNLPSLPNFIRAFFGTVYGNVPHLLEPIWSYLPEFIGDDFYKRRREATFTTRHPGSKAPLLDAAKDVVTDTATGVMDYGVSSVNNLRDGVTYIFTNFMEAAGFTVGRARAYTGAVTHLASRVAGTAYNTAAGAAVGAANLAGSAAQKAVNTAGYVAGTAADVAGTAAQQTYETAAGAAQITYDTAAGVADQAYRAGTVATNKAYKTGAAAAGTAYEAGRETVDRASYNAKLVAEDTRRGYHMGKNKPVEMPVPSAHAPAGATTTVV